MSDYIKKQDVIDIIHKEIESTKSYIEHNTQINIKFAVEELPTLDEKEIIRKAFERVVERLEERRRKYSDGTLHLKEFDTMAEVIEICKEEGELNE